MYSLAILIVIMTVGTVGMHLCEGMSYVDAFYFTSMIATAQGSAITPATVGGKIFASLLAFISAGAAVACLGFLFGPFLGRLWHLGILHVEQDLHLRQPEDKKDA
jgi:hypothetical protein